jgi:hypothetical protein
MRKFLTLLTAVILIFTMFTQVAYAAPTASAISYSKAGAGYFIYGNNPEKVGRNDLADANLGNKIVYQQNISAGTYQFFAEHANHCKTAQNQPLAFVLAVRLKNTSTSSVSVTIQKRGSQVSSTNGIGSQAWQDYLNSNLNYTYTIAPGSYQDILYSPTVAYGTIVNAIVKFNISGSLQFNEVLYANSISSTATYEGHITTNTLGETENTYKGISSTLPRVLNTYSWTIDNSFSGNLPVSYRGSTRNQYYINGAYGTNNVQNDIIYITEAQLGGGTVTYDCNYNLGNWGVQYDDTYTITNTGSSTRTVRVHFYNRYIMLNNDGTWNSNPNTLSGGSPTDEKVITFTVPANSTVSQIIKKIFPANFNGSVYHYVEVI